MNRIDCSKLSVSSLARSRQIRRAHEALTSDGFVILDNVISPEKIRALHAEFTRSYGRYMNRIDFDDTLKVGNRRHMISVELTGGFRDPVVYGNPYVLALVRYTLEHDAILESFGAFISLPGSRAQHVHRDGRFLFDSPIATLLPAHAVTFVMPLVDMNRKNGTTSVWPASHRRKVRDKKAAPLPLDVPVGSCALWDYRLHHRGTANRSDAPRPILYCTYSRHWFQDTRNFIKPDQQHLMYDGTFLKSVPEDRRSLFSHVMLAQTERSTQP
jgi:ectoine hydroxylase-related dioxygenase (phytanoyl-CoA dioxygenase family)